MSSTNLNLWSHTLEDQIQGQVEAGFAIVVFMKILEDVRWTNRLILQLPLKQSN